MRTHVTRQNNEAAPAPARAGLSGRSFPIQAKLKTASSEEDGTVLENRAGEPSRSGASFGEVPLFPEQRRARNENGSPLPESLQRKMGAAFQADFSDVRIHQGPDAASLSALAFTQGRDIHFAPGRYNPSSLEGQKIIAHELAHVIQQRQGRVAVPQGWSVPLNADPSLEAEADTLGAKAVAGQSVAATGAGSEAKSIISPAGPAPIQGFMERIRNFFGGRGGGYKKFRDKDEEEAAEREHSRKKLDKSLKAQTKENIKKHNANLHPKTAAVSSVANKVGTGVGYVGKGVTVLSGGTDLGIGAMVGSGIQGATKGVTKAVEMVQEHQDYADPTTRSEAEPLRPKLNAKSDLESAVEIGGTVAKGLVSLGGEASELLGGPPLPTSQINKGISAVTTGGSRVAKKVDENRNDENAGTADAYAAERERLDEEEVI